MITKIEDYKEFNKPPYLLEQFRNTDVQKALEVFDPQFQELENVLWDFFTKMWIDEGEGVQLDILGKHLGLERRGQTDEMYRLLLKLKATINTSSGVAETIIDTVRFLYSATEVHYSVTSPQKINILQNGVIGLLFYYEIALHDAYLVDHNGDQLFFGEPDDLAVDILNGVVPTGVKLTVTKIT
jgi:hypothetical protein